MRTLRRREKGLLALAALAVVGVALWKLNHPEGRPLVSARQEPLPPPFPRIDLARLDAQRAESTAGRRDLFQYGSAAGSQEDAEELAPPVVATPPPATAAGASGVVGGSEAPGAASLPALSLKYLGSVENRAGVKVAVLLTDRREVLTGQAGEVVANRYRIARIGLESVDIEDIGSGQARRIPLRGN